MNWSVYNDSLVQKGEILLDFSVLEGCNPEVKRMSASRRGKLFIYPNPNRWMRRYGLRLIAESSFSWMTGIA